jgi:ketosteroid isomerase-like protein
MLNTVRANKSRLVFAIAILGLTLRANSVGGTAVPQQHPSVQRMVDVERLVHHYFAAFRTNDFETIERLLSDDYTLIGVNGALRRRAERLAWLRSNLASLAKITPSELVVRVFGDVAVVTGLVTIRDGDELIHERFTQVWVGSEGSWQMISGQVTAVAPEFAPRTGAAVP